MFISLQYRTSGLCRMMRAASVSALVTYSGLTAMAPAAHAATVTGNMGVTLTLSSSCVINSVANLDFGTNIDLAADISTTANLLVTCSNGTPYTVELDAGGGSGATTAARVMTSGANTLTYSIYKEALHTNVFGTGATDRISATGNASAQTFTAYGLVPTQTTPATGTYTDTVTATVTY